MSSLSTAKLWKLSHLGLPRRAMSFSWPLWTWMIVDLMRLLSPVWSLLWRHIHHLVSCFSIKCSQYLTKYRASNASSETSCGDRLCPSHSSARKAWVCPGRRKWLYRQRKSQWSLSQGGFFQACCTEGRSGIKHSLLLYHFLLALDQDLPPLAQRPFVYDWAQNPARPVSVSFDVELLGMIAQWTFGASCTDLQRRYLFFLKDMAGWEENLSPCSVTMIWSVHGVERHHRIP